MVSVSSDRGTTLGVVTQRFDYGAGDLLPFRSLLILQIRHQSRGPDDVLLSWEAVEDALRWKLEAVGLQSKYERYYGFGDSTARDPALADQAYYFYEHRAALVSGTVRWPLPISVPASMPIDLQLGASAVSRRSRPAVGTSLFGQDFGAAPIHQLYAKLSLGLVYDRRNSEFIASRGVYGFLGAQLAPATLSSQPEWRRMDLDLRRYDSFADDRWLWLASQFRYSSSSEGAPLEEKVRLGSIGTLRGLPLYRYASDHYLTLRTELRSLWFRAPAFGRTLKAGNGVFLDTGRVGDTLSRLSSSETHWAWGFTFFASFWTDDFIANADIGFSDEGSAYYIRLGHAF